MDAQVESAITLAFNPTTDPSLKTQAYDFLSQLRADDTGWHVCLSLFTHLQPRPPDEVVRLVCLEIVNQAVQTQQLGLEGLHFVRERLMGYVRHRYGGEEGEAGRDSATIQNKLTQTLTYLFMALYGSEWTEFFDEFRSLAAGDGEVGIANPVATMLYLRIVGSIHDEIADVMIPRSTLEQKRSNDLKDLIRARDVQKIAVTWQEILGRWRQIDLGIVELCLRTIAKWVSWIDISIVIDRSIQSALLELAGQQGQFASESKEARARDAAIDTFTETVGKKMGTGDKIELIRYLNLSDVVRKLISSPALADFRTTAQYDTDLSETVAKLVNNIVFDVVKVLDTENIEDQTRARANELLQSFIPYLLRFFADEYDEICSAVIPSLTDLLAMLRRHVKAKGTIPTEHSAMLRPILDAIVAKMKYDETATWGEEDDATDEAEFQELRKRLYVLQQTVANVDEGLYIEVLSGVIGATFSRLEAEAENLNWRDLDLAMHELYLFGELTVRNGGLYKKSAPSSEASQRLLDMMAKMVDSGLASHPHPAIQLQYMEICVRYVQFFEHNPGSIPKVLESFVAFVHSQHPKVRLRSWYLFQRFVKHLRAQLGNVAWTVVQAVGDLLAVKAELPEDGEEGDGSSEDNGQSADAAFQNQLFLFEAIGCVASTAAVPVETKVTIAKSVIEPLTADTHAHVSTAKQGDARATLQVHHLIMALGALANGFSDWMPGLTSGGHPPPSQLSQSFLPASEAVLTSLSALNSSSDIRTAARHAFSRLLGVLGTHILPQLPTWIDGLLSAASSNDEMAMFLRTLAQVVYGFKAEIYSILDSLLAPLLLRVFAGLTLAPGGTDDEIQLRELRLQYLNFVLVILNNDLGAVLVSPGNQRVFDSFIGTLRQYAVDPSDPQSARLAFSTLNRMTAIWGGPDVPFAADTSTSAPEPVLPGFDTFILIHFAPLPWSLLSAQGFSAGDAQMRNVMQEAAGLQWTILRKTGVVYRRQLETELRGLGVVEEGVSEFLKRVGQEDVVGFRKWFVSFVQGSGKR